MRKFVQSTPKVLFVLGVATLMSLFFVIFITHSAAHAAEASSQSTSKHQQSPDESQQSIMAESNTPNMSLPGVEYGPNQSLPEWRSVAERDKPIESEGLGPLPYLYGAGEIALGENAGHTILKEAGSYMGEKAADWMGENLIRPAENESIEPPSYGTENPDAGVSGGVDANESSVDTGSSSE